MPVPRTKPPLIDLCETSPTCASISIRVSDVTLNSENLRDDEGIINLEDDDDYTIDLLDDLFINEDDVETLSDMSDTMDEATESDDDVVVTGETRLNGDVWETSTNQSRDTSVIHSGDTTVIPNGDVTAISNDDVIPIPNSDATKILQANANVTPSGKASPSPLRNTSPSFLSTALSRMTSPLPGCECRPLKTYPGKRLPGAVARIDSHPGASSPIPLAPGGRSSLSPAARARLISSSPPLGIRSQPTSTDCRSPLTPTRCQTSPLAFPDAWSPAAPTSAVALRSSPAKSPSQSTENLRPPQSIHQIPNSEVDEEMIEKYQLKNLSIHLSKVETKKALEKHRKASFLSYFKIVERSKVTDRVQPLVIKGLKRAKVPYILKQKRQRQRNKALTLARKSCFAGLGSPIRNQRPAVFN